MSNTEQDNTKVAGLDRFLTTFNKGEVIFFEQDVEDFAYMIKQGKVRLVKIINGLEKVLGVVEEGDFLGEMALVNENPRSATAIAIESVQAFKFSKVNFELLMNSNVNIAIKMLTVTAQRIRKQRRQLNTLMLHDDEAQVADALLMMYENLKITQKDNVTIYITPYELMAWAGVHIDKTKQILASYQNARRISIFPDRIILHNVSELERIVNTKRKQPNAKEDPAS